MSEPMRCDSCKQGDAWEHCYHESRKDFKTALRMAWIAAIACCIATVASCIVTYKCAKDYQQFVAQFEYVEETTYQIVQDDGVNTAVIGDGNEVKK